MSMLPDFSSIQATSADLYVRYPKIVTVAFFLIVLIAAVWLFHALFLSPPTTATGSTPLAVNFQGNNIAKLEVHIYERGQLVQPVASPPPTSPSSSLPPGTMYMLTTPQLVENGGFEQGTEGWGTGFFESIFAAPGGPGAALIFNNALARWYIDDQKARPGGTRALRVDQSSTAAAHVFSSFSQRIKLKRNQRYEVSYWAFLEGTDGRGAFSLRVLPSRKIDPQREWDRFKRKIDPTRTGQWQEVRFEFSSDGDTFFDLRFAAETTMKLWVDDVSVTPLRTN